MRTLHITIPCDSSVHDAVLSINQNKSGIVMVVDSENRILGTVTDGDVRRIMLSGKGLECPVSEVLRMKKDSAYPNPVTVRVGTTPQKILLLMQEKAVHQIPVLDQDDRVVGLMVMDDLLPSVTGHGLEAVVMAGGAGTRLRPLTLDMPKPMLPIGDRPLLEVMIDRLKQSNIKNISISTNYLEEKIRDYFGDGAARDVNLRYLNEGQPLGTAGSLSLMDRPASTLLVMNGDILTSVDFQQMLMFHREHKAKLTVAVRQYEINVPYGVIEFDGSHLLRLTEKPTYSFLVNAGIYLIEPEAWDVIPKNTHFNMTNLIESLKDSEHNVVGFPVWEYWLDIGQLADYERAQRDVQNGTFQQ